MNTTDKRNYGLYAIALAIVVAGALVVGAPLQSLVWLALIAACPLMMFFMMRGMHGGDANSGGHDRDTRDANDVDEDDPLRKHDHHTGPRQP
jgi:hypothetical protein